MHIEIKLKAILKKMFCFVLPNNLNGNSDIQF